MPTKIRLQRHGKKRFAYFHVVIADSRAPRDGKFIEKLGTYNPNTNPASIDIDFDKTLNWVKKGAQPTDTVKALLSYKGVIYKNHLDKGVLKGAFSQEEADKKFEKWLEEKEAKVAAKVDKVTSEADEESKKRLAAEKAANDKRAEAIAAKNAALAGEEATEENAEEAAAPEAEAAPETEEAKTEEAPVKEEVKAETKEKAPAAKEEAKAEAKEEAPAKEEEKAEVKEEEVPKAEAKEEKKEDAEKAAEDKKEA